MAANSEMGRLISEGMARAKARRLEAAAQASPPALEVAASPEHEVVNRRPAQSGSYAATNQDMVNALVAERTRHRPRPCDYWMTSIRVELGESLLDLVCLLDEAEAMTGEALPPEAQQLKTSLTCFLAVTPTRGQNRGPDEDQL